MCTLAAERLWRERFWLGAALACAAAGGGYQLLGHGVYSLAMTLCFLPPLTGAVLNAALARGETGGRTRGKALGAGAATLAMAMFLQGVLEIAGAESPYLIWFYGVGALEVLFGLTRFATGWERREKPWR